MATFQTILVPIDFSADAGRALETAIGMARQTGAALHVAHVFGLPLPLLLPYEIVMPDAVRSDARANVARELEKEAEIARREGVETTAHMLDGSPAVAIVELAQDIGADLIVMGTHGRTGIGHVVLGSVAERTLRTAPCAVMTVKGGGHD